MSLPMRKRPPRRLGLLIPLLGSNHEGEVLAAVAAIKRALEAEDLDWHDLASILAAGPHRAPSQPQKSPQAQRGYDWRAEVANILREQSEHLSDWELRFLHSIRARRRRTKKEQSVLDRIIREVRS
jgi:hypothetical protein